ncbi:nucleotidyltransferase domain-containing protein [Brevibacterium atlanticum]|uniref:nucleotidyltransferase domain-containing protein n=1 Tax=Brevibacterium atlanticum TaxID=2697563 RepID=UPI001423DE07|nr:nucleotidyltransferase domain-containing protein [Brevibacterium atlanticum]
MSTAAVILRQARQEAGLTQTALSRLADIPQSVISDYERGRREPGVSALNALLHAVGFTLKAVPEPATLRLVRRHAKELTDSFAELGASNISVFGSVARGDDGPDSDIDLLVDLDPSVGLFNLMWMGTLAEELLGRAVDVVPRDGLKNEVAASAARDEVLL